MNRNWLMYTVFGLAIAVLYVLHFTGIGMADKTGVTSRPLTRIVRQDTSKGSLRIAYVDMDTLNEKIVHIKKMRLQFEAERKAIEQEWENGYQILESQRNAFMQKSKPTNQAEANTYQAEAEALQEKMYEQKQQIDAKKESALQKFSEKSGKFMENLQAQLKKYIAEYNQEAGFQFIFASGNDIDYILYKDAVYDITPDIVEGMNELYAQQK